MKIQNLSTFALASFASVAMSAVEAQADPYADGDLILGFRATAGTGGTTNLLLDLGNIATYRDAAAPLILNLGNLDADLDATYGGTWATRGDVLWSVAGVQFLAGNGYTARTLIASRAQDLPIGLPGFANSTPWTRATLSTQGPPSLKIQALGNQYGLGTSGDQFESTNTLTGLFQPSSVNNSFEEFMSGGSQSASGSSFAYFSGGIEGSFGLGSSSSVLDLYVIPTGSGNGTYEGSFSINDNGQVTFTPAVPEPSSILMLALGGSALGFIRRRQRA